jgi:hypothetical protein
MGSLTSCLTKAAKNISRDDAAAMQETAENFRREGVAPDAAGVQAVDAQLEQAVAEANDFAAKVNEQFGTKVSFDLITPRPETPRDSEERLATTAERAGKTMKVGRVRVVGPVPSDLANLINGWLDQLGADTAAGREAGIPEEVMLVDLPTFRERTGSEIGTNAQGVASHYYTKADGTEVAFIGIDVASIRANTADAFLFNGDNVAEMALVETLAHELGHVIERSMFARLPEADQQQLIDAYVRWLARVEGMDGSRAALERLTQVRAQMLANAKRQGNANPGWDQMSYSKGWREWSADNIARWLLSDKKPQGVVEKFFADVAAQIRKIFARLLGAPMPNPDVADVMRRMVARATAWRGGADLQGVGTMNTAAYEARMRRMGINLNAPAASLDPANVRTLDDNAEASRQALEAFEEAEKRANATDRLLSKGILDVLKGDTSKIKPLANTAKNSWIGVKMQELWYAISSREQIAKGFEDRGDFEMADLVKALNVSDNVAEQLSAVERNRFNDQFARFAAMAPKTQRMIMKLMHDSTYSKIWPHRKLSHPKHAHLDRNSELVKQEHARIATMYRMISDPKYGGEPGAAKLYMELVIGSMRLNHKIARQQISRLVEEIDAIESAFDGKEISESKQAEIKALRGQIKQLKTQRLESSRGPWFPLRREGDFVVKVPLPEEIIKDKGGIDFVTEEDAERAAKRARAANPNNNVRVYTLRGDSEGKGKGPVIGYDVRVARNGVWMFDSPAAAAAAKDSMIAQTKALWRSLGADAGSFDEWVEKLGDKAFNAKKKSDTFYDEKVVPSSILAKMRELKGEGLPASVVEAFQTLALEADAEFTMKASALPRRNVIGADYDMMRALAQWVYGASYTYGALKQAKTRDATWKKIDSLAKDTSDEARGVRRRTAYNALATNDKLTAARREINTVNNITNFLSKLNTMMALAFNPAYVAINATQPHVIATPVLASQVTQNSDGSFSTVGWAEANKYMLDAMTGNKGVSHALWATTANGARDFAQHLRSLLGKGTADKKAITPDEMFEQVLDTYARNKEERALLRTMRDRGALDFGHLAALQDTLASTTAEQKWNDALRMGMAFAQHVETMNRTVTALATYRIAVDKLGMEKVIALDGDAVSLSGESQTLQYVSDMLGETMINYSMVNRPNAFKYTLSGPILQFKMYVQGIYALFIRHGMLALRGDAKQRKQGIAALSHLIASHAVMGGALGLGPIAMLAKASLWMLAMAFGDDEDKWKTDEVILHEFIKGHFGEGVVGTAVERGIPAALLNMDLSSRIGIPNLIDTRFIGGKDTDTPKEGIDRVLVYAAGPAYSTISRMLGHGIEGTKESINYLQGESDGDDVLREFAKASPAGLRSLIDAVRYTTEGVTEGDGDRILQPEDFSGWEVFTRAVGVTPTSVSKVYDQRSREFSTTAKITAEREDVLRMYTGARTLDDKLKARQRIRDFNRNAPDEFKIRPDQANKAVDSRRDREAGVVDRRRQAVRDEILE